MSIGKQELTNTNFQQDD